MLSLSLELLEFLSNPMWDDVSLFGQHFLEYLFSPRQNYSGHRAIQGITAELNASAPEDIGTGKGYPQDKPPPPRLLPAQHSCHCCH